MKVKDLIEALEGVDPEREVILARDAEGNGYHYCVDLSEARFDGEAIGLEPDQLTDDFRHQGYTEEDVMDENEGIPVVVLWPV